MHLQRSKQTSLMDELMRHIRDLQRAVFGEERCFDTRVSETELSAETQNVSSGRVSDSMGEVTETSGGWSDSGSDIEPMGSVFESMCACLSHSLVVAEGKDICGECLASKWYCPDKQVRVRKQPHLRGATPHLRAALAFLSIPTTTFSRNGCQHCGRHAFSRGLFFVCGYAWTLKRRSDDEDSGRPKKRAS